MKHVIAAILGLLMASRTNAVELQISQPRDAAVYQRDARRKAAIPVACALSDGGAADIEVRAIDRKTREPATDWTSTTSLTLPTGWYRLEARAKRAGDVVATGSVEHVGIGEVFIICGQSNSANHGQPPRKASDERISSCDFATGIWRHGDDPQPGASGNGGSPWPILGDMLAKQFDAPIGFICVGVGGTPVSFWTPGAGGYTKLKQALQLVRPRGARAVLWHQGESDSIAGTSTDDYARMLGDCIRQSRQDAGWEVPWGVALASFHPDAKATAARQAAIVAGQGKVIQTVSEVFEGPATDSYHTRGWLCDSVHFNAEGLAAHAQGWADSLTPLLRIDLENVRP